MRCDVGGWWSWNGNEKFEVNVTILSRVRGQSLRVKATRDSVNDTLRTGRTSSRSFHQFVYELRNKNEKIERNRVICIEIYYVIESLTCKFYPNCSLVSHILQFPRKKIEWAYRCFTGTFGGAHTHTHTRSFLKPVSVKRDRTFSLPRGRLFT